MTFVKSLVAGRKQISILNIGVATGHTSILLSQLGAVTSLEYDGDSVAFLREQHPELAVIQGSITSLPFAEDAYDLVCAFDVIEHVDDDQRAIEEMKRVCKQHGHLVVTVPAFMALWSSHDEVNMHKRRYTMRSLMRLFEREHIIYRTYFNFWLFVPIAVFRILRRWLNILLDKTSVMEDEVGADFRAMGHSGLINNMLRRILGSEASMVRRRIRLPFGVSLLVGVEKG